MSTRKKKTRENSAFSGKILPIIYPRKKRKFFNVVKVRSLALRESPLSQITVAKSLKCSMSTVNRMINADLKLKKAKKHNVHHLSP